MTYADADLPPHVARVLRLPADLAQMETADRVDRDPRFPPGWWLGPCILGGVAAYGFVIVKAMQNLGHFHLWGF